MGLNDIIRKIKKPIWQVRTQIRNEIKDQRRIMVVAIEKATNPITDQLDDMEDMFDSVTKNINDNMKKTIDPITDKIDGLDEMFDIVVESVNDNFQNTIEPMMHTLDDAKRIMTNVSREVSAMPSVITKGLGSFYEQIQDLIQQVLIELSKINPMGIFDEVKGTLKIIIPLVLVGLALIQLAPMILMKML